MQSAIDWQGQHISYYVFGHGPKIVFGFHGFSLSGKVYEGLGGTLAEECTIYALDLPFHGKTRWNKEVLRPEDLMDILEKIFQKEQHVNMERVWLMGHSMGGRVALGLFEKYYDHFDKLILFAPDGLILSKWYLFGTQWKVGRFLFQQFSHTSGSFLTLSKWFLKIHLINPSIYKLIESSLGKKEEAALLYKRAIVLKYFLPDSAHVGQIIKEKNISTHLFFGKYDRIILPKFAKRMRRMHPPTLKVHKLNCGHMILAAVNEWKKIRAAILKD